MRVLKKRTIKLTMPQKKSVIEAKLKGRESRTRPSEVMYTILTKSRLACRALNISRLTNLRGVSKGSGPLILVRFGDNGSFWSRY